MSTSDYGLIAIHGFTGSSGEMKEFADFFAKEGFKVITPTLPGHETTKEDLKKYKWTDWAHAVEEAYDKLSEQCPGGVYVSGLSMGGLLSLYLGITRPVKGIITLAAPIVIGNKFQRPFLRLPFAPVWLNHIKDEPGDPSIYDGHFYYPKFHFNSAKALFQLANYVKARLTEITAPIHLFHSVKDKVVPVKDANMIANGVSSKIVKLIEVSKSGHVLSKDLDKEFIMEKSLEFIMKISSSKESVISD
ncbi:MAG: alpha/beta hydrolase [Candidatus Kariarchaeaceae archaeon]